MHGGMDLQFLSFDLPGSDPPEPVAVSMLQLISARFSHNAYNGAKADVWAVGVLMYVMLFGCFPFDHDPNKVR